MTPSYKMEASSIECYYEMPEYETIITRCTNDIKSMARQMDILINNIETKDGELYVTNKKGLKLSKQNIFEIIENGRNPITDSRIMPDGTIRRFYEKRFKYVESRIKYNVQKLAENLFEICFAVSELITIESQKPDYDKILEKNLGIKTKIDNYIRELNNTLNTGHVCIGDQKIFKRCKHENIEKTSIKPKNDDNREPVLVYNCPDCKRFGFASELNPNNVNVCYVIGAECLPYTFKKIPKPNKFVLSKEKLAEYIDADRIVKLLVGYAEKYKYPVVIICTPDSISYNTSKNSRKIIELLNIPDSINFWYRVNNKLEGRSFLIPTNKD